MRFVRFLFATCLFPLLALPAHADGIAQLKAFWQQTQSLRGTFTQVLVRPSGSKQSAAGEFALRRPGKFRWNYLQPYKQLIVSDGKQLVSFDPELKQASVQRLDAVAQGSPAALLAGRQIERSFHLVNVGSADGLDVIDATPIRMGEFGFTRIRLGFADNLPRLMELHDQFGQVTTVLFLKLAANPSLAESLFRFVPPADVDVVGE